MYLNDFNDETCSEKKALSVEDKKFIDLMKQEEGGHFHLLLFRGDGGRGGKGV